MSKTNVEMKATLTCTSATLKKRREYQRSRVKNCMRRSGNSKKVNHQIATGFEQKTSKLVTKEMVREIFNEIIRQNEFTPEAWNKVKIKALHKKGDV